jgi:acyl carrier protein
VTSKTFEQVRGIASDVFAIPPESITAASAPETVESWDSTQHLNLVLALEEKFGFQLSPEEMEQMRNIGEIVKLIDNRLQTTSH